MMLPGFVEAYIHPFLGAFMAAGLDLQLPTSVSVSKRADLVVPGRNLFEVNSHDVANVQVDLTMMDGRFRHGASG